MGKAVLSAQGQMPSTDGLTRGRASEEDVFAQVIFIQSLWATEEASGRRARFGAPSSTHAPSPARDTVRPKKKREGSQRGQPKSPLILAEPQKHLLLTIPLGQTHPLG